MRSECIEFTGWLAWRICWMPSNDDSSRLSSQRTSAFHTSHAWPRACERSSSHTHRTCADSGRNIANFKATLLNTQASLAIVRLCCDAVVPCAGERYSALRPWYQLINHSLRETAESCSQPGASRMAGTKRSAQTCISRGKCCAIRSSLSAAL